jgi:ABC-type spermidine/putrescine transport system permease subunit I
MATASESSPRAILRPGRWRGVVAARQLLALPAFGWTILFFLVPLGILLVYSFGQIDIITFKLRFGWTLSNYGQIGQALYRNAILRSLALSGGATAACLLIGFPVAYYMSLQSRRRQRILLLAILVPFWTSFLVRAFAWVTLLSNGGPIQKILGVVGVVHGPLNVLYTPLAVGIGILYSYLPLMILPLYVALERIDPSLRAAAADLGANSWRTVLRVILPLAVPGIVAGCIMVGVPATGEYIVPAILGGGKTLMFGNVIASQFLDVGNFPLGSALAVALMAGMTVVLIATRRWVSNAEVAF